MKRIIKRMDIFKKILANKRVTTIIFLIVLFFTPIFLYYHNTTSENNPIFMARKDGSYIVSNKTYSSQLSLTESNQPSVTFQLTKTQPSISLSLKSRDEYEIVLDKKENKLIYINKGTDKIRIEYSSLNNGIKEDIIIQEPPKSPLIPFILKTNSISMPQKIGDFMQPTFYDNDGNYQFHLERPYAIDADGKRSDNFSYTIKKADSGYDVSLNFDSVWLRDSNTKYPVTIDPTIVHDTTVELAVGEFNRTTDTGSGTNPRIETYYQELPADEYTVGLWHMNEASGNALDSSGNGLTGTPTGTTIVPGVIGNGRSINGGTDKIVASNTQLVHRTNNFTYEWWIKWNATAALGTYFENGLYTSGILIRQASATSIDIYSQSSLIGNFSFAPVIGTWYHLAIVRTGNFLNLYINGSVSGSLAFTTDVQPSSNLYIGSSQHTTGQVINAVMDEIRISNIARTSEEINASASRRPSSIYTSEALNIGGANSFVTAWNDFSWTELGVATGDGETLADATSLVAQWNFNETSGTTATNNAGSCGASCNGAITNFASTASQDQAAGTGWTSSNRRWGSGALMFDGTDDHVIVTNTAALNPTTAITVESWFQMKALPVSGGLYEIAGKASSTAGHAEYDLAIINNSGVMQVYWRMHLGAGLTTYVYQPNYPFIPGNWYHLTATYDTASMKMVTYVNGQKIGSDMTTLGESIYSGNLQNLFIGVFDYNGTKSRYFNGTIDSTRIYSRALTSTEILSNYQSGQIELQTRVGNTTTPDDGTWEAWRPTTGETTIETYDNPYQYNTTDSGLISYWPMDETADNSCSGGEDTCDRKTTNHGTATGTKIVDGKYGKARYFNGTSDTIALTGNAYSVGSGDFSIESWVRTDTTTNAAVYFSQGTGSNLNTFYVLSNGKVRFNVRDGSSNEISAGTFDSTRTVNDNNWHHIVGVWNTTANTAQIYIDGILDANATSLTAIGTVTDTSTKNIGSQASGGNFPGNIDELRVYNSALSSATVQQHYLAGSTRPESIHPLLDSTYKIEGSASQKIETGRPTIDGSTVGLWHLDETGGSGAYIKDSSVNAIHLTPGSGVNTVQGITGKAKSFDGTANGYLTSASVGSSLNVLASGNFSGEGWIKTTTNGKYVWSVQSGTPLIYMSVGPTTAGGTANKFVVYLRDDGGTLGVFSGTTTITDDKWHYVAFTAQTSGGNRTVNLYVDGVLESTNNWATNGAITVTGASSNFSSGNASYSFNGYIDEVRISNIARSAEEISESYRLGRDHYVNRTISSTDLSGKTSLPFYVAADRPGSYLSATIGESSYSVGQPDSSTRGLWHFDETSGAVNTYLKDSSGNNFNSSSVSNTASVQGKLGKALSFNGSSSSVALSVSKPTLPFTIEMWVNPASATPVGMIDSAPGVGDVIRNYTAGNLEWWNGAPSLPLNLTANQWQHLVFMFSHDGTNRRIDYYKNGQLHANASAVGTNNFAWTTFTLGSINGGSAGRYTGLMDELRISNGTRTPDEIRQAYEVGLRTHPITIDFGASLDSANLITNSGDLSFTVDATVYGLSNKGSKLFAGDKVIVKENYNGIEYIAQGTVTGVTASTGAVIVASWDSGSTFPSGGYTANASVFKWQREYWNHKGGVLGSHLDGITQLSLRLTDGAEGRTIYLDDFKSSGGYLTTPAGSSITSSVGERYFQYRAILSSSNEAVSPQLSQVSLDYDVNVAPNIPSLDAPIGDPAYGGMLVYCDDTTDVIKYRILDSSGNFSNAANAADIDVGTSNRRCERAQIYSNPNSSEKILLSTHNDATTTYIYTQVWDGSSWGNVQFLSNPPFSSQSSRKADGAYMSSGSFMTVYADNSTTPKFAIWNGNSWSSVGVSTQSIGSNALTVISQVRPGTNEIMTVIQDSGNDATSLYYDGSGTDPSDFTYLEHADQAPSGNGYHIDFAWSQHNPLRGAFVYTNAVGDTSPVINIFTADGSGGGSWGTIAQNQTLPNALGAQQIVDRPGTNEFLTCNDDVISNVTCFEESDNDTTPTLQTTTNGTISTGTETDDDTHSFDLGYEQQSGDLAIAVYSDGSSTPKLKTYNPSTNTWDASPVSMTTQTNTIKSVDVIPDPNSNDIMIITRDTSLDIHTTFWDGTNNILYSSGDRSNTEQSVNCGATTDSHCADFAWNLHGSIDATNQSLTPTLQTTATDTDSDYLRYKIEVCENVSMTTNCLTYDQTSSQTGWSGQNTETSTAYTSGTQATYTPQTNLEPGTTYYWKSYAIDPAGTNVWSETQTTPFSFITNGAPETPTLNLPLYGATNTSLLPQLRLTATDTDGDYLRYEIKICTNVAMTTNCQTFDQTTSQTGWSGQNTETSTAYTSGTQAIYTIQTALSPSTTYYWAGRAIDPAGANVWSETQTTPFSFITNGAPETPTLNLPLYGATNTSLLPQLRLTATDTYGDYIRYEIKICTNAELTVGCQTFNQSASQTGWSGQNAEASTAYTSGTQGIYTVQSALSHSTTYFWAGRAIDPEGSNSLSSFSTTSSFTTSPISTTKSCYVVKAHNNSSITVYWNDSVGEKDGYTLHRSINGGAFTDLITVADTVQNYTDNTVSNGNTYQYRVASTLETVLGNWCTTSVTDLQTGSFIIY